jgi:hypothetical protein
VFSRRIFTAPAERSRWSSFTSPAAEDLGLGARQLGNAALVRRAVLADRPLGVEARSYRSRDRTAPTAVASEGPRRQARLRSDHRLHAHTRASAPHWTASICSAWRPRRPESCTPRRVHPQVQGRRLHLEQRIADLQNRPCTPRSSPRGRSIDRATRIQGPSRLTSALTRFRIRDSPRWSPERVVHGSSPYPPCST